MVKTPAEYQQDSHQHGNRGGYAQRNGGRCSLTQAPAHNRVDRAFADDGYVGDELSRRA